MRRDEARSVITCDLEGCIETYNEDAERLFGYAPDEVIGRKEHFRRSRQVDFEHHSAGSATAGG
jgi:PAS domain S-box-containing protein